MNRFLPVLCLALLATATPVHAEDAMPMDHSKMDHAAMMEKMNHETGKKDIYAPAMEKMHKDMMIEATGDADIDFVKGMIPHHQGAIDMAKILKEKGKDPELQKMADDIISAQEKEITFMKDWLKKHSK